VVGIVTLLYSFPVLPFTNKKRIKDHGVLKIITLSIIWTIITVWFPVDQAYYTSTSFLLIFLRRFIFIFSLCIVFDIRDIEIDYKENIRTIPIIAGIKKAYNISFILLVMFVLLSLIQYMRLQNIKEFTAMSISAVTTFFIIKYTRKHGSDLAYIVCLDGMMLLQAMLIMIASI
jgi:4-hydroxybenzoate polyprenyltransferase